MKMENERLCIEISEHGAEVTRIYDKKKETELLWEGNPTYWKRHSPILFPNVGKTYKNIRRQDTDSQGITILNASVQSPIRQRFCSHQGKKQKKYIPLILN